MSEGYQPEISVILPFFNAQHTLARSIESILQQSYPHFELLLIDNNSSDSSLRIATEFGQSDPRIKIMTETQQGVTHAMNTGLQHARGQFIARMDADDTAHPLRLEKQIEFLRQNPEIDVIGSEVNYITHLEKYEGFKRYVEWSNSFHSPEEIARRRFIEIPLINPTIFFRRRIYDELGPCRNGDFPEDYELQLRWLDAGIKLAKIPERLHNWHDYPTRLTRTDSRYSNLAFFKIKAHYFRKWSERHNPFHPHIYVWGGGRKSRQYAQLLQNEGLIISKVIDINPNKKNTLFYLNLPTPGSFFVASLVTNQGAGEQIKAFLLARNYTEGKDFLLFG